MRNFDDIADLKRFRAILEEIRLPLPFEIERLSAVLKMANEAGHYDVAENYLQDFSKKQQEKDTQVVHQKVIEIMKDLFRKHKGDVSKILNDPLMKICQTVAKKYKLAEEFNAHYTKANEEWKMSIKSSK